MNYTLNQLRIFQKVVQTESITRAAEELHLTQPAVSIQMRNFQDQFSIPLTEIIGRKLHVTDFGREVATAAETILNEADALRLKADVFQGKLTGKLRMAAVSTAKYIAPYFITDFLKQHPGVELVLDVTNKSKVIEQFEANTVDFALVTLVPEKLKVNRIELMKNKLYLVGNTDMKFGKKPYDKSLFQELPLIYREEGSGTRMVMEQFIEKNKLPVRKRMELTSNEAVKQAVIAGLGYSILPLIGLRTELSSGILQIIPVKGLPVQSRWNIIWHTGKRFSPVADAYLNFLKENKTQIELERFGWTELYT